MNKQVIAAFDFDGTITSKDTFFEFIRFAKGRKSLFTGLCLNSPHLMLGIMNLYPRWKSKERLFSYFFKGMKIDTFDTFCHAFSEHLRHIVFQDAIEEINLHIKQQAKVIVLSASIENWIKPYMNQLGVKEIIGTKIQVDQDGRISGRFLTPNCNGQEKVRRLLQKHPNRKDYTLIAYGNSNGDQALLNFSDQGHFRIFKK